jgi:1-acyl-sn-glycerol-3-phosphate acyltransferase
MKRIAFWLYQIWAWLVLVPVSLVITFIAGWLTVLVATLWSPRVASRYIAAKWGKILGSMAPMLVTVEGAENADQNRSYVVVCNHQSQFDIFLVYGWLNLDLKWVMKASLRKIPAVGIGCEKAGHIFIDRNDPEQARAAVSKALSKVKDGVGILFFAEGSRSIDGKLRPFKKGAFRIAAAQQLPILPVTILGTGKIQPSKSILFFPGRVRMVIHPPIEMTGEETQDVRDLMQKTRTAIASALPQELR